MGASILPGRATTAHLGLVRIANGLQVDTAGNLSVNLASSDIPNLAASKITTGQLATARGGTGIDSSAVTDGQILIGQTSDNTFGLAALTAGSGVSITNAGHGITIAATGSGGTVTSVGLTLPSIFSVAGSPVTGAGTLAGSLATQVANSVFSGPSTGADAAPTFRALDPADIPGLNASKITAGTLALARGGTASDNSSVTANTVWSGPSSGGAASASYRALVAADIPSLDTGKITTGTLALARLSGITTSQLDSAAGIVSGQITSLAASKITGSNTLPDGVLSTNVPLLNAANTFTALQTATAFAPTGLTGSTAATRYVGGTASVAPTTGAHNVGDWVITQAGSIYICTTAGTPGTWTAVSGGGSSSPLTTKGDMHTYSTTDARLAVGADGTFLSADSSQATGLAYKFPAGVAGVSTLSAALSANVTMSSANTYYDGPSLSLTAGTWLLIAHVTILSNSTGGDLTAKIWDGTTVAASIGAFGAGSGEDELLALTAIVTPTTTTTYKVSAAHQGTGASMRAATSTNAAGNTATNLMAVQLTGAPASGPGALMPAVRCNNSANISIPDATTTALTFNTNTLDQGTSTSQHSTSSNSSRLVCQQAGVYQITGNAAWAWNTSGRRLMVIVQNGTTELSRTELAPSSSNGSNTITEQVTCMYYLNVGDYVELKVYQDSGGALNVLTVAVDSPSFMMARIDSGPGAVQPNTKVQLEYIPSSDVASGLTLTQNTWVDVTSNQTFTVDDANSVVEIDLSGMGQVTGSVNASVKIRINVDSGGTPITRDVGGAVIPNVSSAYTNIFAGAGTVSLTGLSAGSHTVKVQSYFSGTGGTLYCRPATNISEFISLRVLERKQSSGPALIPNTKVQLDYALASDLSPTLSAATWTDYISNQTFTVDDPNSVVEISVTGNILGVNNAAATNIASRVVIDSAGTPINKLVGGGRSAANTYVNFLEGTGIVTLTGLAAGSHTIKLQLYTVLTGAAICSVSSSPNEYFISIRVLERKQAPTPTLNTTARYHQASGTAQSISNATTTVLNFDTLDLDTQSLVTTGSSWKCTAKTAGNYQVSAAAVLASAVWTGVGYVQLMLYKNGSLYSQLAYSTIQVANTDSFSVMGSDVVPLNVGEYLDVRIKHNQGGAVALVGDATVNYIAVNRIT